VPLPELTLAEHFLAFGDSAERDGCTTYGTICRGVAQDPALLDLLSDTPEAQRRPNLLLAAVHFLLLGGADHPLVRHYDSVQHFLGRPSMPPEEHADGLVPDFRHFCLTHQAALRPLLATRHTQTNEVGRCAALLPAINTVASTYPAGQPLALLDLGCSAGLNLLFDHYGYSYRQRTDGTEMQAGPTSAVQLSCTVRNPLTALPPLAQPELVSRTGLDQAPIDPTNPDEARWLLACMWPDNLTRFTRLQGALTIADTAAQRPRLLTGDIIGSLATVVDAIDPTCPLVIFHSWVAAYLTTEQQRTLVAAVIALGASRPVHYLYAESPVDTRGLPTPASPSPSATSDLATALVHLDLHHGVPAVRLADMHPHGTWLNWWTR
jgi:hypothetical protein